MDMALEPGDVTVAVIAKEPRPGRVKTRLCPPATPTEAATIAAAALADTMGAVLGCGAGRRVLVLEGVAGDWCPPGLEVIEQSGGGLGDRLAHAAASVRSPVVIVGMDTPQLTAAQLDDAVSTLCRPDVDAVIGAADDGGYWGIGLRAADDAVFRDVPMSRPDTHREQVAAMERCGLRVARLGSLRDVDTFEDARAVAGAFPDGRFAAAVSQVERRLAGSSAPAFTGPAE